ncbi:flagellar hook protein FlgE [Methylobrevis pamukkalensis]|uniref:Flagellar hook protein FlgE n=1 Tax=Methylobrevis pamukkalensis TaxID=1439726 RepID=A0A1E3H4R5_9HYPH|nr:flagellar hook-basal body complex protein [Methylobrevis pamukkalensis]ODN70766.1 Flagellar hook protein FlgE [Methylobrevis pamukkalensis]
MGILSAISKSVGGLNAQSFALENISGNIANTQTVGYKRTETNFQTLVQSEGGRVSAQASGGVMASARATNDIAGSIERDDSETSMAIQGDGYFVIREKTGEVDTTATFSTENVYTRRGDFTLDKDGYMVNGSGYYLAGLELDPSTGSAVGDAVELIKIDNDGIGAEVTSEIDYKINLPSYPLTANADEDIEGSELWTGTEAGNATITADSSDEFLENSVSGGAVTVYDANGTPVNVQFRWAKVEVPAGAPAGTTDSWVGYYLSDSTATGTDEMWTSLGQTYNFSEDGTINGSATEYTISNLTVNGNALGDITMNHTATGITQYDDSNGVTKVTTLTQDGLPAGDFVDLSISSEGKLVANYSNGKSVALYEIPLVNFAGDSALRHLDGEAFSATKESGPAVYGASGSIVGQSLESSNVDLSDEFTKLIVTQQAFSANSRAITTANDMLSEVLNIVR